MAYLVNVRNLSIILASVGLVGLTQVFKPAASASPPVDAPQDLTRDLMDSPSVQRLMQMFSPEIRTVLNACVEEGGVNLEAGPSPQGTVQCENGTSPSEVEFSEYLDTTSTLLAASGLVGFRTIVDANDQISPELVASFLSGPQGLDILRTAIEFGITQSQVLSGVTIASAAVLVEEVIERLLPTLQNPVAFNTLLGTPEQYDQVVSHFCNAPGMSIEQAKQLAPALSPIQLYSICVQESGVASEVQRILGQ